MMLYLKSGISMFSECYHSNIYYFNEKVVLDFKIKDAYLLFVILFASQFQN